MIACCYFHHCHHQEQQHSLCGSKDAEDMMVASLTPSRHSSR